MTNTSVLGLFTAVESDGGIQRFNRSLIAASEELGVECKQIVMEQLGRVSFIFRSFREICFGKHTVVIVGHINYLVLTVLLASLRLRKTPRLLLIAHGLEVWQGVGWWRRQALRSVARVLCVSSYTCEQLHRQVPAVEARVYGVFPNTVSSSFDAEVPRAMAEPTIPNDLPSRFFLTVSRLDHRERAKGVVTTLEALASLPDPAVELVVAGDGNDRGFLTDVARRLGIASRVHWLGRVTDRHLRQLYENCIAMVLPSGQEGFGIVFLEAMRCGAPIIAAGEKGVLDVVRHNETGLLVNFGDVVGLAAEMHRIDSDALLRARLKRAGLAQVTGEGPFTHTAFRKRWSLELKAMGQM